MKYIRQFFIRSMTPASISLDQANACEWHRRHGINPDHCDRTLVFKGVGFAAFRMLHQQNGHPLIVYEENGDAELSRYWILRRIKTPPKEMWFESAELA